VRPCSGSWGFSAVICWRVPSEDVAPISQELDNETLRSLNAAVAVDGEPAEDVARQFLRESGAL